MANLVEGQVLHRTGAVGCEPHVLPSEPAAEPSDPAGRQVPRGVPGMLPANLGWLEEKGGEKHGR